MAERPGQRSALLWAALLHVGVFAFLLLATLPCTSWESLAQALHLPAALNPVQCSRPLATPGPVIEATLVGPAAAPKAKPRKPATPPPPVAPTKVEPPKVPVKTLPPPAVHPDIKAQQKVAELAREALKAQQAQEAREKQHQAELEAQQRKADKLLKQLEAIRQQREAAQKAAQEAANAKTEKPAPAAPVREAEQPRSGQGGADSALAAQYAAALTNTITRNWLRPDNIPKGVTCPLRIVQIPGGQVISVTVLPSCPFDEPGRRSVENAVRRAQPLPYNGYESVFQRSIILNFKVEE
ncbi:MAG TPA: TonB C-terminal domain-containing protein [Rhodanobacteraceae bacterium]|nr:TonB C-terminal domain-containing protein [Rhodanobacteraceae bacterium]